MTRIVYHNIDEFAEAMQGTVGSLVRTAPAASNWWTRSIDLVNASIQQLQAGGPFTFAGMGAPGTLTIQVLLTTPDVVAINGQLVGANSFVVLHSDRPFVWTASDACRWVSVTFPFHQVPISPAMLSEESSHVALRRHTSNEFLDSVKRFIDRFVSMDATADVGAISRQAAEAEFIALVSRALEYSFPVDTGRNTGRPLISRSQVIARVLALLEANEAHPIFINDLCRAAQVSERALRNIFKEYFGVSPMRLLKVRQLHEIRSALLRTDPRRGTVRGIAARFGVLDLSLLARSYNALFGEMPSQTLSRSPTKSTRRTRADWLQCASLIFKNETATSM